MSAGALHPVVVKILLAYPSVHVLAVAVQGIAWSAQIVMPNHAAEGGWDRTTVVLIVMAPLGSCRSVVLLPIKAPRKLPPRQPPVPCKTGSRNRPQGKRWASSLLPHMTRPMLKTRSTRSRPA